MTAQARIHEQIELLEDALLENQPQAHGVNVGVGVGVGGSGHLKQRHASRRNFFPSGGVSATSLGLNILLRLAATHMSAAKLGTASLSLPRMKTGVAADQVGLAVFISPLS